MMKRKTLYHFPWFLLSGRNRRPLRVSGTLRTLLYDARSTLFVSGSVFVFAWTLLFLTQSIVAVELVATASAVTEPVAAAPVKILSFNIRYGTAPDKENRWELRKDYVLEVMKSGNYDFIGGQEVLISPKEEYNQIKYLSENLSGYGTLYKCREKDPNQGEGTPLFFRTDRWKIDTEEQGTFWLSDTPNEPGSITWKGQSNCPRVCTGGLFHEIDKKGKETGKTLYVYSSHFDHVGEIPRQKAAALIFEKIAQRKDKNAPVVFMGDLNCGEKSPAIRFLKGETVVLGGEEKVPPMKFLDTFRVVYPEEKSVATFNGFQGPKFDGNGVNIIGEKIDYIFITPNVKVLEAEIMRMNRDGKYPSDHYPIRTTIAL